MDAETLLQGLMTAIDEHRWGDLPTYLHPDFECRFVHTGETFTRDEWVAFNTGYPGFESLKVQELIANDDAAACRSRVTTTTDDGAKQFECASFAKIQDGLIILLTEVWTDVDQQAPEGTRRSA